MPANKPRVEGEHYWITTRRVPGVVLCKWRGNTRGAATKAMRCEPLAEREQSAR